MVHLQQGGPNLARDLIHASSSTWNLHVLKQNFLPADVSEILKIPLATTDCEDSWSWHFERKGAFSVKTYYCMLTDTVQRRTDWLEDRHGNSDQEADARGW